MEKPSKEEDSIFLVVIRAKYNHKQVTLNEQRLLIGLLQAFKNAVPDTKIILFSIHSNADPICSDVRFTDDYKKDYLEKPTKKRGEYLARIHLISKKPFFWIQ
jgi:hypothetical protein